MRVLTLLVASLLATTSCQKLVLAGVRPTPDEPRQPDRATQAVPSVPAPQSNSTPDAVAIAPAPVAKADAAAVPAPRAAAVTPKDLPPTAATHAVVEDAAPTPPVPVRLGVLVPLRGRWAPYGKAYLDGAQLAVEAANRRSRRAVEIVPADSQGEAAITVAVTRRLILTEGMVAILGSVQSVPTLVAALEANCSGMPLVSNVVSEDGIAEVGPWVFHDVPPRLGAARASAELAVRDLKRRRAAVLFPDEGDGQALALAFGDRLSALGGEVVFSEAFAAGTTDFMPLARQVAAATPEVLYIPANADDLVLLVPALTFEGVTAQLIGSEDLGMPRVLESEGIDLEGALVPAPPQDGSEAELQTFRGLYTAKVSPTELRLAAAGWLGARSVLDVLAQAPVADRNAVQRGLEARRKGTATTATRRFLVVRGKALQPFGIP